jgi:monovalent cation:H+ antiporter-2, CPA2 family
VGMLFNPSIVLTAPLALIATVAIIILVKSMAAYGIVRAFGYDKATGLTIATSLAQIGEFSFILIVMGTKLAIVPPEAKDLVVAGAMISILANPLLFTLLDRWTLRHSENTEPKPA